MKKITLLLVFVPIFLMTALNFTGGNTQEEHPPYLKGFTCSSCHATIIDGMIINGKTSEDLSKVEVLIELPDFVPFTAIQVDVKGAENPKNANFPVYTENDYGAIYNTSIDKDLSGKKSNVLTFEIPLEAFNEKEEIEIQGLLTNGDGTSIGDYSFAKKLILEEPTIAEEVEALSVFPTVAKTQLTIKNALENALISILNVSGQLVYQNTMSSSKEVVDVSNFENGYYFVQTGTEENYATTKFIVSK